jgi:energy-coupling factor transport system ATP-binding protein
MAGVLKPVKGEVKVIKNNKLIVAQNNYKEIGFIFQNPESHFFYDSIKEELKSIKLHNLPSILDTFLKNVDISRSPFLLSEGEKRRLTILMTVLNDKSILFYDEPTFGQDADSTNSIREMIFLMKKLGRLQFIVSHDDDFIKSLNAEIYELRNHQLVKRYEPK